MRLFFLRQLLPVVFFLFSGSLVAQEAAPVSWQVRSEKLAAQEYDLIFSGRITAGKFLYLFTQDAEGLDSLTVLFADSAIGKPEALQVLRGSAPYTDPLFDQKKVIIARESVELRQRIRINGPVPANLRGTLVFTTGAPDEFLPAQEFAFETPLEGGVSQQARIRIESIDVNNPQVSCGDEGTEGKGLWGIFLLGLIGGFIALLTPCVFPLIPLTVSFFTKRSGTRQQAIGRALLYGFFIFLIYLLLSIPFHLLDQTNPEILNNISTNVWLNLLFFVIFVVFAISFFGYFEISLPGNFASGTDSKASISSFSGIFFMALTLAIVSFSCTGPILGSLLAGALTKEGGAWQLTFGMGGFGLGLALPFGIFALFPQWLQSLPKSGGWLNTVKVVLGFLELAMAVKFLSNADLVEQWGFLKRETFFAIWIVIGIAIVLYLLGVIRFPHDDKKISIGKMRWAFILLFAAMTIYLLPGVTNTKAANLGLISGFPPPLCYSLYKHPVNCDHSLEPLRDYDEALALARQTNKPLLIDFTGWACVNCRRMEENVWTDPGVSELMRKEFVVVSLYVDERRVLPSAQQQTFTTKTGAKKAIITVGDQWATFQSENFNAVAQPQYAILDGAERALTRTKGYTPTAGEFKAWLECGLEAYRRQQ
ncbi:MAG TPA: cytochrome c biogenesis protein CcdA [Lacibacter sp.]|nr:cytochrome c biogenesis protein CcdA [Lacibacter sp.]HMO88835.1 cytochrome c biogenesis protein CcdA [Lacibacter sp.]HMP85873.1 cytochrome c biogenesis protein CcdA [Lacibacter sp.]